MADVVTYVYDSSGRLLLRTAPDGTKTRYYYDGINQLLTREKPVSGVWRTKKVNALKEEDIGQILAHREYTAWSGSTPTAYEDRWYHYDMLGNTTALTDGGGAAAAQYDMEAFGTVKSGGQAGVHLATTHWDHDASMYYLGKRWLFPSLGRFNRPNSPYSFANNNPVSYAYVDNRAGFSVDPAGEISWSLSKGPQKQKPPPPTPTPCPTPGPLRCAHSNPCMRFITRGTPTGVHSGCAALGDPCSVQYLCVTRFGGAPVVTTAHGFCVR